MDTGIELTKQDLMYVALIGAGVGVLLGLIPLVLAIKKGKLRLGLLSVVLSTVAGGISVIISLIVIAIFLWLILRKSSGSKTDSSSKTSDSNPS